MEINSSKKAERNTFIDLIKENKHYDIVVAVCTIIVPFLTYILGEGKFGTLSPHLSKIILVLLQIFLIVFVLIILGNIYPKLTKEKENNLKNYINKTFREGSRIRVLNEENTLYGAVNITANQFYYAWIVVWVLWLFMYISEFINLFNTSDSIYFEKVNILINNVLNLTNSVVFFFIYFVISESSVKTTMVEGNKRGLKFDVILLLFIVFTLVIFDLYTFFANKEIYLVSEFYNKLIIAIIATISMIAVIGKLNSSFLAMPQWLLICLYFYATIQMLYPFMFVNPFFEPNNCLSLSNNKYIITINSMSTVIVYIIPFLTLLGKVCLFLFLRWIFLSDRFIFFVLHKSNSLYESNYLFKEYDEIMNAVDSKIEEYKAAE